MDKVRKDFALNLQNVVVRIEKEIADNYHK